MMVELSCQITGLIIRDMRKLASSLSALFYVRIKLKYHLCNKKMPSSEPVPGDTSIRFFRPLELWEISFYCSVHPVYDNLYRSMNWWRHHPKERILLRLGRRLSEWSGAKGQKEMRWKVWDRFEMKEAGLPLRTELFIGLEQKQLDTSGSVKAPRIDVLSRYSLLEKS